MPGTVPDFELVTSLRYDPKLLTAAYNTDTNGIELPYLFFRFHIERLAAGATAFGWTRAASLLRAPGTAQRLLHMCDQAVMESPLTGKEKGIGVSVRLISSRSRSRLVLSLCRHSFACTRRVPGGFAAGVVLVVGDNALRWQ